MEYITENLMKSKAPLYHRYPGQTSEQGAYIEIRCASGTILADWNGEIGNAVPFSVWHGHDRRYDIPATTSQETILGIFSDPEFQALCERIVGGYSSEWDGNNHVARLTENAEDAEHELESYLAANESAIEVWDVNDWLFSGCSLREYWSDQPIADAVAALENEIDEDSIHIDGDIEEALLQKALSLFEFHPDRLTETHINELLSREMISQDEADEWRQDQL